MSAQNQDRELERYLRGDTGVSRAYRAVADGEPPAHLDRAIQAAARRAVGSRARAGFGPFKRRWTVPAAAAAVLVLAVGLVTFLSHESVPLTPGAATPELPAETATKREAARPDAPDTGQAPSAGRVETGQSTQAAADARKRSDAVSSAESPPEREIATSKARQAGSEAEATVAAPAKPRSDVQESTSPTARAGAPESRELAAAAAAPTSRAVATLADVLSVSTSGGPGAYQFVVTVRSADTGCQQYADWWEVLAENGRLLHRRILLHSHVDEQPFTRSGGPVPIGPDTVVWVRAHMHPAGYGGTAMRGSVSAGFRPVALAADFSANLAQQAPLPGGCDF
jgi:hypothetical protein